MDVVVPQSWAEARLDASAPRDRAPLLAIVGAIEERVAASRSALPLPLYGPPPGGTMSRWLAGEVVSARSASGIIGAIRELQKRFISFVPRYDARGYVDFPDHLASNRSRVGSFSPDDALARIPLVPHPAPGDSSVSAATRAFYAWCRASLDEMTCIDGWSGWSVSCAGIYSAGGTTWNSVAELVRAAERESGTSLNQPMTLSIGGIYNRYDGARFDSLLVPVGIAVRNSTHLPADARFACTASVWPCDGSWQDGESISFASFVVPGIDGETGISSVSVRVAPGGTAVLWSDPGSCPVPSFSPPSSPPDDPSGWQWRFSASCQIAPFLDFSKTFRFRADE